MRIRKLILRILPFLRLIRNYQNEKKRRDQFNMLIQELGSLLNHPRK
jgi:hypothetical protein